MTFYRHGILSAFHLSVFTHLSLLRHPLLRNLFSASSSLSWLHQMSPTTLVRSHAAIQGNLINSSFNEAQFCCCSRSHCYPSCCCSQQQRTAAPHRWASALPWNKLSLRMWMHAPYTVHLCVRRTAVAGDGFVIYSGGLYTRVPRRQSSMVSHTALVCQLKVAIMSACVSVSH